MILKQLIESKMLSSKHGNFDVDVFFDGKDEVIVLKKGEIQAQSGVLCRIQSSCTTLLFSANECDCLDQISASLKMIKEKKRGLLILLKQEGKGNGFVPRMEGITEDNRNYRAAVKIIKEKYEIRSIKLITTNKKKIHYLKENGISIDATLWYSGKYLKFTPALEKTIRAVQDNEAINPVRYEKGDSGNKTRVLIFGDLNIDRYIDDKDREDEVGGTAYNAWLAFQEQNFMSILFGSIGDDENGIKIEKKIIEHNNYAFLRVNETIYEGTKESIKTPVVKIHKTGDPERPFHHEWDIFDNANDYSSEFIEKTRILTDLNKNDFVYVTSYLFVQKYWVMEDCKKFFGILKKARAKIILDLAKSSLKKGTPFKITQLKESFNECKLFAVVGDITTFWQLLGIKKDKAEPADYNNILDAFNAEYLICRYVDNNEDQYQAVFRWDPKGMLVNVNPAKKTDFKSQLWENKIGYGDKETAKAIRKILDEKGS